MNRNNYILTKIEKELINLKSMRKAVFIFSALCLVFGTSKAETPRFVNLELLGVYNLVGVSFDSRFNESSKFGYKIGMGYGYEDSNNWQGWSIEMGGDNARFRTAPVGYLRNLLMNQVVSVPMNIYYLFGKNNSYFELGAGLSPYFADFKLNHFDGFNYYGFLQTAYRYEREKLVFSIGIDIPFKTPGSDFEQTIGLYPKLSIGYRL